MSRYRLKPGRLGRALIAAYRTVEAKFTDAFLAPDGSLKTGGMAPAVTGVYRQVEHAAAQGYKRMEKAFVEAFLEKVGKD